MEIHSTVDWIRYTADSATNLETVLPIGFSLDKKIAPLPYYNLACSLAPCGRIDWNTLKPQQGASIMLSGDDIRTAVAHGMRADEIIANVQARNRVKFTRIDLAVDIINGGASPTDIMEAYKAGQVETRAKKCRQVIGYCAEQQREGNTVYLGSRTGELYMRVYEKGLETISKNGLRATKNEGENQALIDTLAALDWTRVELEIKGKKAPIAARAITHEGSPSATNAALRRFVQLPKLQWWNDMLARLPQADTAIMQGENHNQGASRKWLMLSALPAVINAIRLGDSEVIDAINEAMLGLDGPGLY